MKADNSVILSVLFGQFISQLGSAITGFVVGILAFQINHRVTDLGLLYFFYVLPSIVCLLPAGYLVSFFPRKKLIILSDVACIFALGLLFFKVHYHTLNQTDLYLYATVCSAFGAIQGLAMATLIANQFTATKRARFNILLNLRQVIPRLVGPLFAGFWIVHGSIPVLLIIDAVSSCFSIAMAALIRDESKNSFLISETGAFYLIKDYWASLKYLYNKPHLLWSMSCLIFSAVGISLMGVYIIPMALHQSSAETAGKINAMGGLGAVLAGWLVAFLPEFKFKLENLVPLSLAFQGFTVLLGSLSHPIWVMGLVLFIYYFLNPWQRGCSYALWENAAEKEMYGKILATKSFILQIASALTFLIAGPLADKVLNPYLMSASQEEVSMIFSVLYGATNNSGMELALSMLGLAQFIFGIKIYWQRKLEPAAETCLAK